MQQLIEFAGKHLLLSGGFVAIILLLLWTEFSKRTQGFKTLSPPEAIIMMNQGKTRIVDVSAAADFNKGHIVGAKNFPLSRFTQPDRDIENLAGNPVLVACKNGQVSPTAAAALVKLGAREVAVLKGGMSQWLSENFPVTHE